MPGPLSFFRTSFRFRLTLWNVTVLALVLAAYAVALSWILRAGLAAAVDRELADRAHGVASWWARFDPAHLRPRPPGEGPPFPWPGIRPPDDREPPLGGSEADRRGFFRRPRLLSLDGDPLVPFSGDEPWDPDTFILSAAGQDRYSTVSVDRDSVRVFSTPLKRAGEVEGVIQVAHLLTEQQWLRAGLVQVPLALIPLALLVAAAGGVFLTDRALRPVRQVSQAAAQIGAEDLSRRLVVHGRDELATLSATFNGMIGRLEEAFRRLEQAYAHLEAAYEQQRRFTGDASHELRTPLTRIKGSASLALSRDRSPEEYRRALEIVDQAADSMNRIVQDLLLLARSDAGRLTLMRRPVRVETLLEHTLPQVARDDAAPPIDLDLPAGLPDIDGDPDHLVRVLVNLLDNALRHTPPEGRVTVSAVSEGGSVVLRVEDTGEGIPEEHLSHVTERFYRVDPARSRARGGIGLGLSICQSIAQSHGGTLTVDSRAGIGTTVSVSLPAAADRVPA